MEVCCSRFIIDDEDDDPVDSVEIKMEIWSPDLKNALKGLFETYPCLVYPGSNGLFRITFSTQKIVPAKTQLEEEIVGLNRRAAAADSLALRETWICRNKA
jgi:hypothetical protein